MAEYGDDVGTRERGSLAQLALAVGLLAFAFAGDQVLPAAEEPRPDVVPDDPAVDHGTGVEVGPDEGMARAGEGRCSVASEQPGWVGWLVRRDGGWARGVFACDTGRTLVAAADDKDNAHEPQ